MFLKYKVDIPVVPGKLVRKNRGGHTYIEYEYDRIYDPVKRKCLKTWRSVNENFLILFSTFPCYLCC